MRDAERRRHVVADHDAGDVELLLRLLDHVVDVARPQRILPGGRLVVDHDLRLHHDRAREPDALLLALGDLARHAVRGCRRCASRSRISSTRVADLRRAASGALARAGTRRCRATVSQSSSAACWNSSPKCLRTSLSSRSFIGDDVLAEHPDLAAVGFEQAHDVLDDDRLAGAAGADEHGGPARVDRQVDAAQHALAAEALVDADQLDDRRLGDRRGLGWPIATSPAPRATAARSAAPVDERRGSAASSLATNSSYVP